MEANSLEVVLKGQINDMQILIQKMAWQYTDTDCGLVYKCASLALHKLISFLHAKLFSRDKIIYFHSIPHFDMQMVYSFIYYGYLFVTLLDYITLKIMQHFEQ